MAQDQDTNGFEALGRVDNRLRRDGREYSDEDRRTLLGELEDRRRTILRPDGKAVSRSEQAASIGISASVLSELHQGKYKGDVQRVLARIDEWLADEKLRGSREDERGFVMIGAAERAFACMRFAIKQGSMALIVAQSGSGKSMIAKAFAADRQDAYLITVDVCRGDARGVVGLVYSALSLGWARAKGSRLAAILEHLNQKRSVVLLVDECQRLQRSGLEVLRSMYDSSDPSGQRNTPIILFGDHSFYKLLMKSRSGEASPIAPQVSRRIYPVFDLDEVGSGGKRSDAVYSVEDLSRVLRNRRLRLVTDVGIEWLCRLANLDGWGRIGLAVVVARVALELSRERPLGVAQLRLGLRMVVGPQALEVDASSGGALLRAVCA